MAFPTTSVVLDSFNRANEGPPPSASWENIHNGLKVVSNVAVGNNAANNQSHWLTSYGPDLEAWATVSAKPGVTGKYMGLQVRAPGGGVDNGYGGYFIDSTAGTDTWEMYKITAGAGTILGAAVTGPEVTAGNKVGMEIIGNTISLYHFTSSWALVMSRTDSTYTAAGEIGLYVDALVGAWEDFGGGTVVTATSRVAKLALSGVG